MKTVDELWDEYFTYIWDIWDISEEYDKGDIKGLLSGEGEEFTSEMIQEIYDMLLDSQQYSLEEIRSEARQYLKNYILDILEDENYTCLSDIDIASVFTELANEFLP